MIFFEINVFLSKIGSLWAHTGPYGPISKVCVVFLPPRNADAHVRVSASIVVLDRVPPSC